jgi:pyruvate kinase
MGNHEKIACSYQHLNELSIGSTVLIADGKFVCEVVETLENGIKVKVQNAGKLGQKKNMCLPGVVVKLPTLTEQDEDDLINFGLVEGIDIVAASFVRKASDVEYIRDVLGPRGGHIQIISKIENHEGIENYDEILEASDGIMVARGDMGMEIPMEKVFIAQKYMIDKANIAGKPIITATQMLESMIENPRPTRAEITDIANAVLDGTDCVMLSGETANGKFPLEAIKIMAKVCAEAELCINYETLYNNICKYTPKPYNGYESICAAAVKTASEIDAALIIVITEKGYTARLTSKFRPKQRVLALSANSSCIRGLNLSRGIWGIKIPSYIGIDNLINDSMKYSEEHNFVTKGDKVVIVLGHNEESINYTNQMKIAVI